MAKNELVIKATLDETQFEREAEQMARTMDKMHERSYTSANNIRQQQILNQNLGKIGLPQTPAAAGAFQSATAQGDKAFREETQAQLRVIEQRRKQIKDHADAIQKLEAEQKKFNRASMEALDIEKKITNEKVRQAGHERDLLDRTTNLNKVLKEREVAQRGTGQKMAESFSKGGVQGALKTGVEAIGGSEALLALGVAGAAVFAIRQITNLAESIVREIGSVNRVTQTASGNAVAGSTGNYLSSVYGGRSMFEMGNAGERSKALGGAMDEEMKNRGFETFASGDTSKLGSHDPTVSAAGLGFGALNATFGGDLQRARFFGRFSESQMKKYNAMSAERMVRNYNENFEANKNQDPGKQRALENYEATHNRDLDVQRKLGLSDNMMYGSSGFMRSYQGKGFTNEQGMGAMSNILAAGGSTRMANTPATSLQFAKNFDLTNADQSLGKLSGTYGDSNKSKSALIEILSEGTRRGLNTSEFREEQRKFTEAAVSFLAKGYTGNDSDMERMAGIFGGGLNAKTGQGITAASNSADIISGVASSGTGPEGALGFSSLLSSKVGKRLSDQSQQRLNTMSLTDMTESNPSVVGMAMEASRPGETVSPQDIIQEKMNSVKNKLFRNKDMQSQAQDAVKMKDLFFPGKSNSEIADMANQGDPKAREIISKLNPALNFVANAYGTSNNQAQTDSLTDALAHFGTPGYKISDDTRAMIDKQTNGGSTRLGDKTNENIARDQGMVTDKTASMLTDFNSMADVTKKMSADMVNAFLEIQKVAASLKGLSGAEFEAEWKKRGGAVIDLLDKASRPSTPQNQPQGGKR